MIPLGGYTRPRSQGLSLLASRLIWKHGKCPGNPQRFSSGLHSPQSSIVETVKKKKADFLLQCSLTPTCLRWPGEVSLAWGSFKLGHQFAIGPVC